MTMDLPWRQSCDRCHGQKVRCVGVGAQGSAQFLPDDHEAVQNPGQASVPCARCKRAGVLCIYSPQLPPGRPTMRRRRSQRSRHHKRLQQGVQSYSPRFSSPSLDSMSLDPFVLWPTAPSDPYAENAATMHEGSESIALYAPESSSALGALSPSFLDGNTPTWLLDPTPALTTSPEQEPRAEFDLDEVEKTLEELTELSQRCYRAARMVTKSGETTLSVSSSGVNEITNVTTSLIYITNRLVRGQDQQTRHFSHPSQTMNPLLELPLHPKEVTSLDPGIVLMILSCYHRLLVAFGDICSSLCLQLNHCSLVMPELTPHITPPSSLAGTELSPGSTPQAVMMVKLISYLLRRLDRGFVPLGTRTDGKSSSLSHRPSFGPLSSSSASRTESPQTCGDRYRSCRDDEGDWDNSQPRGEDSCSSSALARSVVRAMQNHRLSLETQIQNIEHLIEKSENV